MSRYLVEQFEDIVGRNCSLYDIWDGVSYQVAFPDGSSFAVMEGGRVYYYRAQYDVIAGLTGPSIVLDNPRRYGLFNLEGYYTPTSGFKIY